MIIEVMTIITLMTQPVDLIDVVTPSKIFYTNPTPIPLPLTAHLEIAWKEYKTREFIASSA